MRSKEIKQNFFFIKEVRIRFQIISIVPNLRFGTILFVIQKNLKSNFAENKYKIKTMLSPKRVKYRKHHRGRLTGKATRGNKLVFGDYGLQVLEPSWITSRQIEAARRAMTRQVKRGGKIWIRMFPDKPVTMRPAETRMGSGKGAPEYWVAVVKPGKVLYELKGIPESVARTALRLAASKLPVHTQIVTKS